MKGSKANPFRTQEAIARFGDAARHPICLAWLRLQERETMLRDVMKGCELPGLVRQQKKKTIALYKQFCKEEGKEKEAAQAAELLRKSNELLQEAEGDIKRSAALRNQLKELRSNAEIEFALEQWQAKKTKNTKALRGLEYLKKTVNRGMSNGQKRAFGILKMLRDKVFTGAAAKGEGAMAYWVAGSCGYWPLSDESWQGRRTVMDFRSGLEAMYGPRVAGDKHGKIVRRTLEALGNQYAEDRPGRKRKGPCPPKAKRPVGRPREFKAELIPTETIDLVESYKPRSENWSWKPSPEYARKQAEIERELATLGRARNKASKALKKP